MAGTTRTAAPSLEAALLEKGHEFSFFQAMRLLGILTRKDGAGAGESAGNGAVRVRPELSLAFPAADIARIERKEAGYLITARFLGLYGSASPLPTFYTEELLDEAAADAATTREFLDIINHRLYALFFACAAKYRLFFQVAEEENKEVVERLFCLAGLDGRKTRQRLPDPHALLRYVGLLSHNPRSALGLRTLLKDALGAPVEVIQCVRRRLPIPPEQRAQPGISGCTLGVDAVIGSEKEDRMGMFRLRIGPLTREEFSAFLPGEAARKRLSELVRSYLPPSLAWDLELLLAPGEATAACLGAPVGSRLGWDTWLGVAETGEPVGVVFPAV
ncbi:type VI secretion system baseplate subunit TssG [Geobacter sp.]|uniref:type VI secretion system baseplate subunit TssG n=1 Tax=Geobacter sp. TaxID=46610 RepID=UPI002627F793|nr:type VI secretion system baseplate subunit TssG [Geobacter sp.]